LWRDQDHIADRSERIGASIAARGRRESKTSFTANQQPASPSALLRSRYARNERESWEMRKYAALHNHLNRRRGRPEMLSFEEIEAIIGKALPQSAVKHRSFWANDYKDYHSHARAWMGAGYRVAYVDRDEKIVRFERTR
jgi:hypothetical protein